jgi:hypothetical protein
LVVLLLAGAAFATLNWWKRPAVSRPPFAAEETQAAHEDPLWSKIFAPHRQTSIVVADTNLVMVQDILDSDVPLSEYFNGGYPERAQSRVAGGSAVDLRPPVHQLGRRHSSR